MSDSQSSLDALSEALYAVAVGALLGKTAIELVTARGDASAIRDACRRYFKRGGLAGLSTGELVDFLGVSSGAALERAGYSDSEEEVVWGIVAKLTEDEIEYVDLLEGSSSLRAAGASLYCWSSGGAEYARATCRELGVEADFDAFLPKPTVVVDDVSVDRWPRLVAVHPNEAQGLAPSDYESALAKGQRSIGLEHRRGGG